MTADAVRAGALLDIAVRDHVIIGSRTLQWVRLRERRLGFTDSWSWCTSPRAIRSGTADCLATPDMRARSSANGLRNLAPTLDEVCRTLE